MARGDAGRRALFGARFQALVGGLAIDDSVVVTGERRRRDQPRSLGRVERSDATAGRHDQRTLGDAGPALLVEQRDERLADAELRDGLLDREPGIRAHRLRGRFHGLLIARRERAQRVLHAVAELAEHGVGNVERILRDEIHADALRANEPHDLLDLLEQRFRRVGEQQMRFVEEEHEPRLVRVADLGQPLEQLREHPEQEASRRAAARSSADRPRGY